MVKMWMGRWCAGRSKTCANRVPGTRLGIKGREGAVSRALDGYLHKAIASAESSALRNLFAKLARGHEPADKFEATMFCESLKTLLFIMIVTKPAQAVHLCLRKSAFT